MDRELKGLRDNMIQSQGEFETFSKFHSGLNDRIAMNTREVNTFNVQVGTFEKERGDLLQKVANNEASEVDVAAKTKAIDELKLKIRDKTDLISTLMKTKTEGEPKLKKLDESARGSIHSFWFKVFEIEKAKLRDERTNPMGRCLGALQLSGVNTSYAGLLQTHFMENFSLDVTETKKALEKEYLKGGDTK